MDQFETKRCILCLRPATSWTGHVISKNKGKIFAGWCKKHSKMSTKELSGFYGHYTKKYGKRHWEDQWK